MKKEVFAELEQILEQRLQPKEELEDNLSAIVRPAKRRVKRSADGI
jgi:hypothetical protein